MTTRETTKLALDALVALVEYHTGVDQVSAINDGRQAIAALTAELAKPEPSESAAVALLREMRADYATFPAGLKDKIDAVLAGQEQDNGSVRVEYRTIRGVSVPSRIVENNPSDCQPAAYLDTAQPALSWCACRWGAEDNRIATCTHHQGWLDVLQEWADRVKVAEAKLAQPNQALSLDLLERLSKTLTRLGCATPEGGMEHFNADLANQLYNLCRAVDSLFDREQPPAPGEAAREYMTGYSDGREWAGATNQAQPSQAVELNDAKRLDWIRDQLFEHKWNGVVGKGCTVQWAVAPDFRFKQRELTDDSGIAAGDFRRAIDAAINAKEQLNG